MAAVRLVVLLLLSGSSLCAEEPTVRFTSDVQPLLKRHCLKCHGPAKQEAGLNLSTPGGLIRGGMNGAVIVPHDVDASLFWRKIADGEMPPDSPLSDQEKGILKTWIVAGAPGLPSRELAMAGNGKDHWAFQPLRPTAIPQLAQSQPNWNVIDLFLVEALQREGLSLSPEADRTTLIRRVAFDLTGLPPKVAEIDQYLADNEPGAYARMVERYLASPHYGERWGKYWLDAAGYADSNGYFNADSDRPLAWRYRDWVVRAFNNDMPFDRFIREQIAGDELARFVPGTPATPEIISLLEATHYLRNSQDGTGESDGNDEEVRIDRYTVIEGTIQNFSNSLFGLTIQCAKCHDHKFEPLSQRDYYQIQAILAPVYSLEHWRKPNDRFVHANLPGELEKWEAQVALLDAAITEQKKRLAEWSRTNRPRGEILFADDFDAADAKLAERWNPTAPDDSAPSGNPVTVIDGQTAPSLRIQNGQLQVLTKQGQAEGWVCTNQKFDWTPADVGGSVQVTFDLLANRIAEGEPTAERIGYYIAAHNFKNDSPIPGGNVLIDGNPQAATNVYVDYPGGGSVVRGPIGGVPYQPGRNFGVRITRLESGKYRLEHLVDFFPDGKSLELDEVDLPDGAFGLAVYSQRSFVIDNLSIEKFSAEAGRNEVLATYQKGFEAKKVELDAAVKQRAAHPERPGKISWVNDATPTPPDVFVLERGDYAKLGAKVEPAGFAVLSDSKHAFKIAPLDGDMKSSGRRLALANWVTAADSLPAALLARVQVNRIWQKHFGTGLVSSVDNLGISGASPSHPELLEWLAREFATGGDSVDRQHAWEVKRLHRLILNSAAYRQRGSHRADAAQRDPNNRLLWRFSVRRLDAEAIRDSLLAVSGDLDPRLAGPFAPTKRTESGEVVPADPNGSGRRRSIYLQQRRTQVTSLLAVFDAPTIIFNSMQRSASTMPLQTLALLNSDFVVERAASFARQLEQSTPEEAVRLVQAWRTAWGREPSPEEFVSARKFLDSQSSEHTSASNPRLQAWVDLCQMLLAANEFIYVE